ncbi:alcohol dehydrogenase-like regulatory protein ErcA [Magnetococcus sp. PR-3]|uniref:alcohol dehydrogenase-like regulatory protein ErcA n=1 Tax=Magnetococcus sp. PR-3 TaxID=3120355 RepID=UPI002FCE4308
MENICTLRKFVVPETVFGVGARKMVSQYVRNYAGNRVLIVTDHGVMAAGWVGEVEQLLTESKIESVVYAQVTPNPRDEEVEQGAKLFKEEKCDVIVAVGGGSPMDCAKGIAVVAANGEPIGHYEGIDQIEHAGPPLICIPTTAGTAADLSQFAIITALSERRKFAIISKITVPDVALIDPETNLSMDPMLTACTGVDALVHAVEAFVSSASSALTDTHALTAMELVSHNLPQVLSNPGDIEARAHVALGCMHAGMAFSNASLGAVHAMAHALGGMLDLPHGECNAILLRHVVSFNSRAVPERFDIVGDRMGLDLRGLNSDDKLKRLLGHIDSFTHGVGIKDSLGIKGVRSSDLPGLAYNAMMDPCMITNPRRPNQRDIEVVYEEAL